MFSCLLSGVCRLAVRAGLNCWFAPTCDVYNVWVLQVFCPTVSLCVCVFFFSLLLLRRRGSSDIRVANVVCGCRTRTGFVCFASMAARLWRKTPSIICFHEQVCNHEVRRRGWRGPVLEGGRFDHGLDHHVSSRLHLKRSTSRPRPHEQHCRTTIRIEPGVMLASLAELDKTRMRRETSLRKACRWSESTSGIFGGRRW